MNKNSSKFSLDKFSGNKSDFPTWKDRVLTFVEKKDQEYMRYLLEKDQPDAKVLMKDMFEGNVVKPVEPKALRGQLEVDPDIRKAYKWEMAHWNRARTEMKDLLNQSLPVSFVSTLPDTISNLEPHEVWCSLENSFGSGDTTGVIDLTEKWSRALSSNWRNLRSLFSQLKKLRNEMNRKFDSLIGRELVSSDWLVFAVLKQLPSEFWGSSIKLESDSFNIEAVEKALISIFGEKSRKEIITKFSHDDKATYKINHANYKKRVDHSGYNKNPQKKKDGCFYCLEDGHQKANCNKMKSDRDPNRNGGPLFRSDINSKPSTKRKHTVNSTTTQNKKRKVDEIFSIDSHLTPSEMFEEAQVEATEKGTPVEMFDVMSITSPQENENIEEVGILKQIEEKVSYKYKEYLYSLKSLKITDSLWILDTGAGNGLTSKEKWFKEMHIDRNNVFFYPNGSKSNSSYVGTIKFNIFTPNRNWLTISCPNIAYVSDCDSNLICANHLARQGYMHIQSKNGDFLYFINNKDELLFAAVQIRGVYYLPTQYIHKNTIAINTSTCKKPKLRKYSLKEIEEILKEWHIRLGHINKECLMNMISKQQVVGIPNIPYSDFKDIVFFCKICAEAKFRRMSYKSKSGSRPDTPLHTLHMDSMGPFKVLGIYGNLGKVKYVLTIVDDNTSYKWSFVLKSKNEITPIVIKHINMLEKQFPHEVKRIRTDGGTEFVNKHLQGFCDDKGIKFEKSNVECQEENGSAERGHQTSMGHVRCSLLGADMQAKWWPEALKYGTEVSNRTPTARLKGVTPYEKLHKRKPDASILRIWGSTCYVHIPTTKRKDKKLSSRGLECKLLGLSEDYKGYRLWDMANNRIIIARDIKVDKSDNTIIIEKAFPKEKKRLSFNDMVEIHRIEGNNKTIEWCEIKDKSTTHGIVENTCINPVKEKIPVVGDVSGLSKKVIPIVGNTNPSLNTIISEEIIEDTYDKIVNTPRPKRAKKCNVRLKDYVHSINIALGNTSPDILIPIPKSLKQAVNGPNKEDWLKALNTEYDALIQNDTWELVLPPKGRKVLGSHWLLDVKYHASGAVDRFKARLVVQGNNQQPGIDFGEIFAPVARYESLRLVLAIATIKDYYIHQMDVSTAFLNGELDIDIYMRQPQGFKKRGKEHLVCKLKKSLYGLKQAPRIWYQLLHQFLLSNKFSRCYKEYCIYSKKWEINGVIETVIICVYVDDLTIAGSRLSAVNKVKEILSKRFKMKDLGDIHYMLKMEIKRDRKNKLLSISQHKYIQDLLIKYDMVECNIVDTPQAVSVVLEKEDKLTEDEIRAQPYDYRGIVGCLIYLVRGTRPDIANAVRELSKFLSCYNESHWRAAKRVLKYLKGTSKYGLVYNGTKSEVVYEIYTDASFANATEKRKSVTGFVSILAGACISWKSARQDCTSLFTAQSELIAVSEGVKESEWLWVLLSELNSKQTKPINIWCDNTAAISIIKNPINFSSTKHIEVRYLYAREVHEKKRIDIKYCSTNNMIADALTKALPKVQFQKLRALMGIRNVLHT